MCTENWTWLTDGSHLELLLTKALMDRLESVLAIGKHSFESVAFIGLHYMVAVSYLGQSLLMKFTNYPNLS